ncbi:LOW QUALITY PROTEIN: Secreted protein [Phytophthora megakarya]|uniref:Secreted protein n=1 Tax=Phytophthora megakarya TaxID=4795 RepID=A0A225W0D9_9STRA|nr:LOW QUALITY PROTEIN: Secreted protein [Phytophthora megakarya]
MIPVPIKLKFVSMAPKTGTTTSALHIFTTERTRSDPSNRSNSKNRIEVCPTTRWAIVTKQQLPTVEKKVGSDRISLNQPLQKALSEFVRRMKPSLPSFVELIRGQTEDNNRPNKLMSSAVIETIFVSEEVRVHVCEPIINQKVRPANLGSPRQRLNVLRKNIRKEQDAWRWLALGKDIMELWPEIFVSPFGIVDKADGDPSLVRRTTHDLSYPEFRSINNLTDQSSIPTTEYVHCDAIAIDIIQVSCNYPDADIEVMDGDVAAAFRNVSIHSHSVRWFGGLIEEEQVLILDLCCPFGWAGSPGHYEIVRMLMACTPMHPIRMGSLIIIGWIIM